MVDECFSINPKRVEEFCERIKPYKLFWSCQMRVETYSEPLIIKMVDAGCVSACFGLENMSQIILDDMNKKATVKQMEDALDVAYRNKGGVVSNILFGAAAETVETVRETMTWVMNNPKYSINDFVMIGAYPGSGYYEYAVKRGIIKDKKQFIENGCPIINLTNLSNDKFRALVMFSFLKRQEVQNKGTVVKIEKMGAEYNAVLKCSHCGYENYYKKIPGKAYNSGRLHLMECRQCHNYSDYILKLGIRERWKTSKWLYDVLVGNHNNSLKKWATRDNVKEIAIYGIKAAGIFVEELSRVGIKVKYGIDREHTKYQDKEYPVYGLVRYYEKVDVILVLAIMHYDEILCDMSKRTSIKIISFEDILE